MYATRHEQKNNNVIDILNSVIRNIIFDLNNSYTGTELNLYYTQKVSGETITADMRLKWL
jgi:hypothetical protein